LTERLYYADSYTRAFSARIVERLHVEDRPAVVLDRTYFYPASGGQPADHGALNGVPVLDVLVRAADEAVLHVLQAELAGAEAQGEVEWERRFDHMQQHSGQHILSQAFLRAAEAETVSFHLSPGSVTIDLAGPALDDAAVARAEDVANAVVVADVPVRAWFPSEAELARLALRRTPDGLAPGALRVVAIGDFDFNACGGTHVARAGELGLIKVVKLERRGAATRVEFRCGGRALADYRRKNEMMVALAAEFTCGVDEVPQAVGRLRTEAQEDRRALKAAREELLDYEAAALLAAAPARNGWRVVRRAWPEREPAELRGLAGRLAAQPGAVALLGNAGPKAQLVLARSADIQPDMRPALQAALAALGGGRGGGNPALAQGGGSAATLAQVESALAEAEATLVVE
jgi:alanyl-tRNA synthetase